jgi:hypothetical protein
LVPAACFGDRLPSAGRKQGGSRIYSAGSINSSQGLRHHKSVIVAQLFGRVGVK